MRRSTIPQLLGITAVVAIAPALFAQTAPSSPSSAPVKTGKAHITGVVVDSLNRRYMSGADVVIDGANITLRTDSVGAFRIDSLPPGTYQVGVFDPLLDTLGTSLATRPFHIGPDSASYIVLAVPSAATIVGKLCQSPTSSESRSAVIGHVHDPETLQPIAGAEVSIAWTSVEASKEIGIRRTPHLVRDTTDSSGAFRFCGLPNSLAASLQARRGPLATSEIPITLGDQPVEFLARDLLLSAGDSALKSGNASVSGVVSLEGNAAASGTRVELLGTDRVAITNEKGEFEMQNLPSGSRVLLARHLGFAASVAPVDLSSQDHPRVSIKLAKFVAVMDPILVTARRSAALDKVGFGQRSKIGMGYYLGPDRIARMHPYYVSDILRQVPSLRVVEGPYGPAVKGSRSTTNGCVQFYLDDMPYTEMTPGDVNQFVNGAEVAAVEVYQPGMAPGRFMGTGNYSCTTVVLWTRYTAGN
jgi:carboxypeptidase family protein